VFDNSAGRLKGGTPSYNEISIKRKVARDGQSSYYLNGIALPPPGHHRHLPRHRPGRPQLLPSSNRA
jgi:hypothetical protein